MDPNFLQRLSQWKIESAPDVSNNKAVFHTTLVRGEKVTSRWKRGDVLGQGGFGKVWLQENDRGDKRAIKGVPIKILKQKQQHQTLMFRELKLLSDMAVHTKHFPEFFGWYDDQKYIYISMEYIEHGDLNAYLRDFELEARANAREITRQLTTGLQILHHNGICHRDIKPDNVLVVRTSPIWVKIIDFGASKSMEGTSLRTSIGTYAYKAPEILFPDFAQEQYTISVDLWSLACLVHVILTSEIPFIRKYSNAPIDSDFGPPPAPDPTALDTTALSKFIKSYNGADFPPGMLNSSLAGDERDFLEKLMVPTPSLRMSAAKALEHPWLRKVPDPMYLQHLENFIKKEKPGLKLFFPDNLDLTPYAINAECISRNLQKLGCEEDTARALGVLALYDLAILIDDSYSMEEEAGLRIRRLEKILDIIGTTYTFARSEGIPFITFLSAESRKRRINTTSKYAASIMKRHNLGASADLGTRLKGRILNKLVINHNMEKPLLIITITGGTETPEIPSTLKTIIKDCIRNHLSNKKPSNTKLPNTKPPHTKFPSKGPDSVAFQFLLVGNGKGKGTLKNITTDRKLRNYTSYLDCTDRGILNDKQRWDWARDIFLGVPLMNQPNSENGEDLVDSDEETGFGLFD